MAAENEVDADSKVMLADIRGDIRLINDRHLRYSDDIKRVQEQQIRDITRIDGTLHSHGSKIGSLEAFNLVKQGERQGIAIGAKVLWTLIGGSILAIGGAVVKVAGL